MSSPPRETVTGSVPAPALAGSARHSAERGNLTRRRIWTGGRHRPFDHAGGGETH
jgi:hypothetical protein